MSYTWITWLADALRAEGCKVKEYEGWKDRGRPSSTGAFAPHALLLHHTGTKTSATNPCPTLSTCVHGRSDLPGPLCHVLIGYDGTCHVIAAGRANHAGECNGNGPTYAGDGNEQMVGFEIDYSGSQAVSDVQADAVGRAATAVLRKLKRDESYCRGHKETSTTGKWDPGRHGASDPAYDMGEVRKRIRQRLAGGGGGEDDDMPAWVALTTSKDQSIGAGATEVIGFDHEASDSDGAHSETSWVAAIRPPTGYGKAHFMCRVNLQDGDPGALVRLRLLVTPVDESKSDSTDGYDDAFLGEGGGSCHVWSYMQGVGNDRRYRIQLTNYGERAVILKGGAEFRAMLFK